MSALVSREFVLRDSWFGSRKNRLWHLWRSDDDVLLDKKLVIDRHILIVDTYYKGGGIKVIYYSSGSLSSGNIPSLQGIYISYKYIMPPKSATSSCVFTTAAAQLHHHFWFRLEFLGWLTSCHQRFSKLSKGSTYHFNKNEDFLFKDIFSLMMPIHNKIKDGRVSYVACNSTLSCPSMWHILVTALCCDRLDGPNLSAGTAVYDSGKGFFSNLTFKYYDLKKLCSHLPNSTEVNYPAKPSDAILNVTARPFRVTWTAASLRSAERGPPGL